MSEIDQIKELRKSIAEHEAAIFRLRDEIQKLKLRVEVGFHPPPVMGQPRLHRWIQTPQLMKIGEPVGQ